MKRNKFSLSHFKLLSCDMGELVPIACVPILPGDTFKHRTSLLLRLAPLLSPVMHPVHVRLHHWWVPLRIIWDDFPEFITGGPDGADSSVYPTITDTFTEGTLADYLGVPPTAGAEAVSALPFRAYAKIWNEWYRDQDLQTELVVDTTSGADTTTNKDLQFVNWEKDYFTASRPWEQKGPSVTIPISGDAPVTGIGVDAVGGPTHTSGSVHETDGSSAETYANYWRADNATTFTAIEEDPNNTDYPNVRVSLSALGIDVLQFRQSLATQRFQEWRAKFGSRYVEYLMALGVPSSDGRLQRPEFLGSGRQTVQFSEVLQTAEGTNPVGEMRGHGIAAAGSNTYLRFFEEHGLMLTLMSVKPIAVYADGLHRDWIRSTKEDFWQREYEHIGQQPVENQEVYLDAADPDGVFGYADRYAEYRGHPSSIAGEFRSTLNNWHFARLFGSEPALNSDFVECSPTDRVFAAPSEDVVYCMAMHNLKARRLVSKFGNSFTM